MRINYFIAGGFVVLIFLVIIFVTTVLPASTFSPAPTEVAHKYTPKELRGRNIYRREGCFYCHTQFVRYQDREAGEMVQAGDYLYEAPHVLGTERTGPDLSNVGGKYPDEWHHAHHFNPRKVKPGSIMPSYSFLTDAEMSDLTAYLQTLGAKRKMPAWVVPPQEMRDEFDLVKSHVNVNSSAAANAGRGIFMQNCSVCHGVQGKGNGPISMTMATKPANFLRPYFLNYSDAMWYWRVKEGVPGTRMPRWGQTLNKEQMLYLVAFLKTLPQESQKPGDEVLGLEDVDNYQVLDENFRAIDSMMKQSGTPYGTSRNDGSR